MKRGRKRTSIIWTIEKEKLQEIVDGSNSFIEIILKLGMRASSGSLHQVLKERFRIDNINTQSLKERMRQDSSARGKELSNRNRIPSGDIFKENSKYRCGWSLKKKILSDGIFEYKCSECGNEGIWNNKKLTLQLDHINGINNDNRIENLRFLCPNCHTQTPTFGAKNKVKKPKNVCKNCGVKVSRGYSLCPKCSCKNREKITITKEELIDMIDKFPMTEIAKRYNVSDTIIKRRCKKFGIVFENRRGYWTGRGKK